MSKLTFKTQGVCSTHIDIETSGGVVTSVVFSGGCNGNAKGISALVVGCEVSTVIAKLEGIPCGGRATSCPDQLANALKLMSKD